MGGERAGHEIGGGADLEGDTGVSEQVHEGGMVDGGDAVADAFDGEEFDRFADFFRAADFAGMDQTAEAYGSGTVVNRAKIRGSDTQFITADSERDDFIGRGALSGLDDSGGGFGAKLANGIENPAEAQAAGFERFGGAEDCFEISFGRLAAQQHDAYR